MKKILSLEEVAEKIRLSERHVRKLFRDGDLPGFKRGRASWGAYEDEIEKWIEDRRNGHGEK